MPYQNAETHRPSKKMGQMGLCHFMSTLSPVDCLWIIFPTSEKNLRQTNPTEIANPNKPGWSPLKTKWCPKKTSPLPLNLRLLWHQQHLPGQGRNGPKLPENLLFKVFSNYPRIVPITQAPARLSLSLECNFRCPPKSWKTYHCHPWCLSFSTFFQDLPFVCNHIQ